MMKTELITLVIERNMAVPAGECTVPKQLERSPSKLVTSAVLLQDRCSNIKECSALSASLRRGKDALGLFGGPRVLAHAITYDYKH